MMKKRLIIGAAVLLNALFLIGCPAEETKEEMPEPTYTVTYNGNENTGGEVPVDTIVYKAEDLVTVKSETPTKSGSIFDAWELLAEGVNQGGSYKGGQQVPISKNITFKARWTAITRVSVPIVVLEGNDTVIITATGSFAADATAYVKDDGTALTITKATSLAGFTKLDETGRAVITANLITLKLPYGAAATVVAGKQLSSEAPPSVTVNIEIDAQIIPVTITPVASTSPARQLAQALDPTEQKVAVDNVNGKVSLSENLSIPTSMASPVIIPPAVTFVIPNLKRLTITGSLSVEGILSIEGGDRIIVNNDNSIVIRKGGQIKTAAPTVNAANAIEFGSTTASTVFNGGGTWTASGNDITITSSANGASFAKGATAAQGLLTAAGTPTITQQSGVDNALTIGAGVTIVLGGTTGAKVGEIVLAKDEKNPGKLEFAGAGAKVTAAPEESSDDILTESSSPASFAKDDTGDNSLRMQVSSFKELYIRGGNNKLVSIEHNGGTAPSITGPKNALAPGGSISAVTDCKN